jgi:YfiH family protein
MAGLEINRFAEPLEPLLAWATPVPIHGFMNRAGGISDGPFASMNLASWVGDHPAAVEENWRRWSSSYPGLRPVFLDQQHGRTVHVIEPSSPNRWPGDAMVTRARGIALCIFTADCVPILMIDRVHGIAGALHAGWRGTLADIAAQAVRAMAGLGADRKNTEAALGPSIGVCCFEVEQVLADRFAEQIFGAKQHTKPGRPGKAHLDLRAILTDQLVTAGLDSSRISNVGPCTKCARDRFFSRRAAEGRTTGLQMSFIGFPV